MDTDSIYAKLNISYEEYLKTLEENKDYLVKYWSDGTRIYK